MTKDRQISDPLFESFKAARAIPFATRINAYLNGDDNALYYLLYMGVFYTNAQVIDNKLYLKKCANEILEDKDEPISWRQAVIIAYFYLSQHELTKANEYFACAEKTGPIKTWLAYTKAWQRTLGFGMAKDLDEARKLLTSSADQNNTDSQYQLAMLLKDDPHHFETHLKQAAHTHPLAQVELAQFYLTKKHVHHAYNLFAAAATQGCLPGLHGISTMLMKGEGQPKNIEKALTYLQAAAEAEYQPALFDLAELHQQGKLIEKNWQKSARLFRCCDEKGKESLKKLAAAAKNHEKTFVEFQAAVAERKSLNKLATNDPDAFREFASEEKWNELRPLLDETTATHFLTQIKSGNATLSETLPLPKDVTAIALEYFVDHSYLSENIPIGDPILEAYKTENNISYLDRMNDFRHGDDDAFIYVCNPEIFYSEHECKNINAQYAGLLDWKSTTSREKILQGLTFLFGKFGIEADLVKARQLFREAAEEKETQALAYNMIGVTYEVENNISQAEAFYLHAAKLGDKHAMYNLSYMILDIGIVSIDGLDFLYAASDKKFNQALIDLSTFLHDTKRLIEAVKQGSPEALARLAIIMHEQKDDEKAFQYASVAAEKDNIKALTLLGDFYRQGIHVEINLIKAAKLYRKSYQLEPANAISAKENLQTLLKNSDSITLFSSTKKIQFAIKFHAAIAFKNKSSLAALANNNSDWFCDLLKEESDGIKEINDLLPPLYQSESFFKTKSRA